MLRGRHDFKIKKGDEYLMYIQMLSMECGVLKGIILKARPLDECWDKS